MSFALKTTALAAALCAALATAPFTAPTAEAALFAQDEKQATLPDFVKLVEENGPAVVNIQIIRNARVVASRSPSSRVSAKFPNSAARVLASFFPPTARS